MFLRERERERDVQEVEKWNVCVSVCLCTCACCVVMCCHTSVNDYTRHGICLSIQPSRCNTYSLQEQFLIIGLQK